MIDPDRCKKVVNAIKDLSQTEIDELFKLLHKDHCEYTQNNNGIFFNLSWISEETMTKIEQFIEFCHQSNTELVKYETLCDVLNHSLYEASTDKKETINNKNTTHKHKSKGFIEEDNDETKKNISAKISSSMKFYLLKKKFSKPISMATTFENDLMREDYII